MKRDAIKETSLMTDKEFYSAKNVELFIPDGVEFLGSILDYTKTHPRNTSEARTYGLELLGKLLEKELIEVFRWANPVNDFSKEGILNYVKSVWFVGADYPDFYGMPMFKYKDWYLKALEDNWSNTDLYFDTWVEDEIGDIGAFIEQHRPK
jgi:hypothetical protein